MRITRRAILVLFLASLTASTATGAPTGQQLTAKAEELARRNDLLPSGTTTHCNQFVHAFASELFSCNDFQGKTANQIVQLLKREANVGFGPFRWSVLLIDPVRPQHDGCVAGGFSLAQDYANEGRLVVVGHENPAGHGHVAVVVPGSLERSDGWGLDVPQIAQAGTENFAKGRLSKGFGSDKLGNGFVLAILSNG